MLNILICRKFLAALVLALHVTPARRLLATFEKYKRCSDPTNPPDELVAAILDLFGNSGWTNSLEDLGVVVGAPKDDDADVVKLTTLNLLKAIVDKLLQCQDFKVKDMARRQTIEQEIKTVLTGNCPHKSRTVSNEKAVALYVAGRQGESLTFAELQYHLKIMKTVTEEEDCQQCGESLVKTVQTSVEEFCDPDFLTIVLEQPTHFSTPLKAGTKFGSSRYKVKTIVHWDNCKSSASVSREKEDGWWWHGVVDSQGPDFGYTAEDMHSFAHLRDVAVMMMVRIGGQSDYQETEEEHAEQDDRDSHEREMKSLVRLKLQMYDDMYQVRNDGTNPTAGTRHNFCFILCIGASQ